MAIVFANKGSYLKFSQPDLGDAGESIIGYFALFSNRMTMYDLTGVEGRIAAAGEEGMPPRSTKFSLNPMPSEASRRSSTRRRTRFPSIAGCKRGSATAPTGSARGLPSTSKRPDLRSAKGWSGVGAGAVNRPRLEQFRKYLAARPSNSLDTLIRNDQRFIDAKEALDAYAEAWALTHFLMHKRSKDYVGYVSMLSKKKPLLTDTPDERMEEFRRSFGELKPLDTEFLRYMAKLR